MAEIKCIGGWFFNANRGFEPRPRCSPSNQPSYSIISTIGSGLCTGYS